MNGMRRALPPGKRGDIAEHRQHGGFTEHELGHVRPE